MPEPQYYCLKCDNGEHFFQFEIEHRLYEIEVYPDGETGEGDAQDESDFTLDPERPGVFCVHCREAVEKIIPPPAHLDLDAFEAYIREKALWPSVFTGAAQWRQMDPVGFDLERQNYNYWRRKVWAHERQKEHADATHGA